MAYRRLAFVVPAVFSIMITSAAAQVPSSFERGWVDINLGMATAAEKSLNVTTTRTIALESGTFASTYSFPRGAEFDFGGGVMITPMIGAGISVTGTADEDSADLFARVPHPLRFNAFGEDTTFTQDKLQRTEGTIHLQAMFVVPTGSDRLRVRAFGGPSYVRLKMDAISGIHYDQQFQILGTGNIVNITTYDTVEVEHTTWGFHVGGDVSYFFTRVFGLGAVARYSQGSVEIDDVEVLREKPFKVKTGGFQLGGGLRLKF